MPSLPSGLSNKYVTIEKKITPKRATIIRSKYKVPSMRSVNIFNKKLLPISSKRQKHITAPKRFKTLSPTTDTTRRYKHRSKTVINQQSNLIKGNHRKFSTFCSFTGVRFAVKINKGDYLTTSEKYAGKIDTANLHSVKKSEWNKVKNN